MRRFLCASFAGLSALFICASAYAQRQVSQYPAATTPLSCNEYVLLQQNGVTSNAPPCTFGVPVIGTTAPATNVLTGRQWIDTSTSPPTFRVYDGTQWVATATLDTSAHKWTPSITLSSGNVLANTTGSAAPGADTTLLALVQKVLGPTPATGQVFCISGSTLYWCSNRQGLFMTSTATQAGNTTQYYPCSGTPPGGLSTAVAGSSALPFGGTYRNLVVIDQASPGAGTFTATLLINGSAPVGGPACVISGSGVICTDTSDSATAASGNTCSIRIVSSAAASTSTFQTGIELDNP